MEFSKKVAKVFAVIAVAVSPTAVFADYMATGTFEETVDVDGAAIVHVSNESGAIEVTGDDVDQVTIRAKIRVNKRLSASNPQRASQIIRSVKRSPPVSVEDGRIDISKLRGRFQRHASVSYEIIVPRDSEVTIHSVSGNVKVSGVAGVVNATSDEGKVTLADASVTDDAESSVSALTP
ncbi:MAG: hypothetical protein AAGA44_09295 [Pseudomonadota bacterium]